MKSTALFSMTSNYHIKSFNMPYWYSQINIPKFIKKISLNEVLYVIIRDFRPAVVFCFSVHARAGADFCGSISQNNPENWNRTFLQLLYRWVKSNPTILFHSGFGQNADIFRVQSRNRLETAGSEILCAFENSLRLQKHPDQTASNFHQ